MPTTPSNQPPPRGTPRLRLDLVAFQDYARSKKWNSQGDIVRTTGLGVGTVNRLVKGQAKLTVRVIEALMAAAVANGEDPYDTFRRLFDFTAEAADEDQAAA